MIKKKLTRKKIIKDIIQTAKRVKNVPTRKQYRKFGGFASSTIENKLGSWGIVAKKLKATHFSWA